MNVSEVPDETQKLILLLRKQTEEGRREWAKGATETEFKFVDDAGSVLLLSVNGDGTAPFELRILDETGAVVEKHTSNASGTESISELYEAARRSSIKAAPAVKALLRELNRPTGAELQELIGPTVASVKATPNMPEKVALLKPLLRRRVEILYETNNTTLKWPELIAPFPSGGGIHNALTQAFKELRASGDVVCTVEPEPGPDQGFGGGKVIQLMAN